MLTSDTKVFVIDKDGTPLLPTTPRRARVLLNTKKAKVVCVSPFTIQIDRSIKTPVGEFVAGIDDGSVKVGLAIINRMKNEIVFRGEMRLRLDVKRKLAERSRYRRHRRSRKLRCRPSRHSNRNYKNFVAPSVRQRKDSIVRFLLDMKKRLNITSVVVEEGCFDTCSMVKGKTLVGKEYLEPFFPGENRKQQVLFRDKWKCCSCGSKYPLEIHHIKPRAEGGSNAFYNLITLCKECHAKVHSGEKVLPKISKEFKFPVWLMVGKKYLLAQLKKIFARVDVVYGYMTGFWRRQLGLEKSHINDAVSMIAFPDFSDIRQEYFVLPRRKKEHKHPRKKMSEHNGFCSGDLVKAYNRNRGYVRGIVMALYEKYYLDLKTRYKDNLHTTYNNSVVLWKPHGIVYI